MSTFQPTDPADYDDDDLFAAHLRARYNAAAEEAAAPPPPPGAWAGVAARLQPPAPRPGRSLVAGVAGLITGVMLMGWWNSAQQPAPWQAQVIESVAAGSPAIGVAAVPERVSAASAAALIAPLTVEAPLATRTPATATALPGPKTAQSLLLTPGATAAAAPVRAVTPKTELVPVRAASAVVNPVVGSGVSPVANSVANPATASPTAAAGGAGAIGTVKTPVVLVPLVRAEEAYAALALDSATKPRRVALRAHRTALLALLHRTDSLLTALGEPSGAAVAALAAPAPDTPVPDTTAPAPMRQRWSVLIAGAPERNFFGLAAPAADTVAALRRTHEQGRGGWNIAALAEYRLTPRWSVSAGAGLSTTGAELRLTDRQTVLNVHYDTTTTHTQRTDQVTIRAYSVQFVPSMHLDPRFNLSGQVIGYDTVWVPRPDTTWTVYTATNLTQNTTRTITPLLERHEKVTARVLRPNYRFLTIPLLVRFRLGRPHEAGGPSPASRWWTDVAAGAQLQWFLGGSHLVTEDGGRTYRTEQVGAHGAAFRPLNIAVMGQVAINYALTPHLAASVAPTVRWQPQSIYKTSTGLNQKPTATGLQLGVRYTF